MKTQTKRKTLDFSYPRVKIRMGKIITCNARSYNPQDFGRDKNQFIREKK